MGNKDGIYSMALQQGKEIIMLAAFCVFMVLLCMMFIAIGIIWPLADFVVKKLEKAGCL